MVPSNIDVWNSALLSVYLEVALRPVTVSS